MSIIRPMLMRGSAAAAAPAWNPADKDAGIVLANSNKQFTSAGTSNVSVRGVQSRNGGKRYYEVTAISANGANAAFGFANASASMGQPIGGDANGIGYYISGGIFYNGAFPSAPAVGNGSIVGCALDFAAGLAWFSANGSWQNGDPVAGTGGTAIGAGTWFPAGSASNNNGGTANFAGPFAYGPPSSFSPWG